MLPRLLWKDSPNTRIRRGLTLMELLVVLVILAIVATIAVQSLQPRVETARFELTRKMLTEIQQATCGEPRARQADGSPLISGFVSDIGRLPLALAANPPVELSLDLAERSDVDNNGSKGLDELWDISTQLAVQYPFQFRPGPKTPVDCSDIQLPCGWRGPYLNLPVGQKSVRDAWARPFDLAVDEVQAVTVVTWQPTGHYEQPLQVDLKGGLVTVSGSIQFGDKPPTNVKVVLLAPDPSHSLSELKILEDEDNQPANFQFRNVPIGLRAIRIVADGKTITRYIEVPHGGLTLLVDGSHSTEPKQ